MAHQKLVTGTTEEEVWQQLTPDLQAKDLLRYKAAITQGSRTLFLDIDIDPGGGFESGYATTTLTAPLQTAHGFKFAVHQQHLIDDIGKFFGMQDVAIGYPEFDKNVIVKTNNEAKVKAVFADENVRQVLAALPDFTFEIRHNVSDDGPAVLQLLIEEGITDPASLRAIYEAFYKVLRTIDTE